MAINKGEYLESISKLLIRRKYESGLERRYINNKLFCLIYILKLRERQLITNKKESK